MKAVFNDHEDASNPMNGHACAADDVLRLLRSMQARTPFFCSLRADSGELLIGVHRNAGCIQFTSWEGGPPYLMALGNEKEHGESYVEFLSGGTSTPVNRRYLLQWQLLEQIVTDWLERGEIPRSIAWEEV